PDTPILIPFPYTTLFRSVYPEEPSLQYQRIAEGSALPAGSGPGANRNHRAAALQRRVSLPGGLAGVSGRDNRAALLAPVGPCWTDRKSTRLNSSHGSISY